MKGKRSTGDHRDPWQRAFEGDVELNPAPLIRGIDDYETAIHAHRKAHQCNASSEYKEQIAAKLRAYSDE